MVWNQEWLQSIEVRCDGQTHQEAVAVWLTEVALRKRGGQWSDTSTQVGAFPAPGVKHVAESRIVKLTGMQLINSVAATMLVKNDFGTNLSLFEKLVTKAC